MKKLLLGAVVAMSLGLGTGCVVRETRPRCGGGWVEGHYGPRGAWHPGHCRGAYERVEVY